MDERGGKKGYKTTEADYLLCGSLGDRNIACKLLEGVSPVDRSGTLVLSVKSARLSLLAKPGRPSSSIFDDLDLGSTRKPGPKAKLPVPVEGGLVRSPREVRGR